MRAINDMTWADAVFKRLTDPPSGTARRVETAPQPSFANAWRTDVPAAAVVYLIALPLCLGVGLASGAPPSAGIISGVVGGVVVGALSGSQLMVSGPAAGLTAVVIPAIITLSSYRAFLVAVVLSGVFQVLLAWCRAGVVAYYFPSSVIRGMLAAIGLILILKQVPHAVGYDANFAGDEAFLQANAENTLTAIVHALSSIEPAAIVLSLLAVAMLAAWGNSRLGRLGWLPGAVAVVLAGTGAQMVLPRLHPSMQLGAEHFLAVPVLSSLSDVSRLFASPDWAAFWRAETWQIALVLAIVGSLESLLSLEATDRMDPYKREAPSNRELAAQGAGNIVAGLIGGLPVTGVIVRSAANVDAGAQSRLSAILQGLFLAATVLTVPALLNRIPLASLAILLIYTGFKLLHPSVLRYMWLQGRSHFVPFVVTLVAIFFTNLPAGVAIGLSVGFIFILVDQLRFPCYTVVSPPGSVLTRLRLHDQVTFLNKATLARLFDRLAPGSRIEIDGTACRHIDHDVLEYISDFRRAARLKRIDFRTVGITLPPISPSH